MPTSKETLIDLETRFWQAIVDQDADSATGLLNEPALMVSSHGAMQFDHAGYRKMVEQGPMVLNEFELSDMKVVFPNDNLAVLSYHVKQKMSPRGKGDGGATQEVNDTSTWVRNSDGWKCVMHTESPAISNARH